MGYSVHSFCLAMSSQRHPCSFLYCRSPNNETLYAAVLRWAHGHSITIRLIFSVNVRRDSIPCDLHDTVARSRGHDDRCPALLFMSVALAHAHALTPLISHVRVGHTLIISQFTVRIRSCSRSCVTFLALLI